MRIFIMNYMWSGYQIVYFGITIYITEYIGIHLFEHRFHIVFMYSGSVSYPFGRWMQDLPLRYTIAKGFLTLPFNIFLIEIKGPLLLNWFGSAQEVAFHVSISYLIYDFNVMTDRVYMFSVLSDLNFSKPCKWIWVYTQGPMIIIFKLLSSLKLMLDNNMPHELYYNLF